MSSSHTLRSSESESSDLLADIALSTLGIVMIIMLVYMIKHRDVSAPSTPASIVQQPTAEENAILREKNRQLNQQVQSLSHELSQSAENQKLSGLWRFRTRLTGLVDEFEQVTPADWVVDYYVHLEIVGGAVSGTLFGVHENDQDQDGTSSSCARISGTLGNDGRLSIELFFTGKAAGGSEIIVAELKDRRFVGQLKSGSHKSGFRNYVGPTVGIPLDDNAIAGEW